MGPATGPGRGEGRRMRTSGCLLALLLITASCQRPDDRAGRENSPANARVRIEKLSLELLDKAEDERSLELFFLERMLRNPAASVRQRAADVAGRTRFQSGAMQLIEAAGSEKDVAVLGAIAFSLGQLGDGRALDLLARLSRDDRQPSVQQAAVTALGRIVAQDEVEVDWARRVVGVLIETLGDSGQPELQREAALSVWRHGEAAQAAIEVLSRLLLDGSHEDPWPFAYALMKIDHADTSAPLRQSFSHRSGLVRTYAAWGARQPLDSLALEGLDELLLDKASPWTARVEALRTIGKIREKKWGRTGKARDVLLRHLIQEQHPLVAPVVVESLGMGTTALELPFIIGSLDAERSVAVRSAAVGALASAADLGLLTPSRCGEILAEFITDDSPWLRTACASAFADLGAAALPSLLPFLEDPDRRVRAAAVSALASIEDPSVGDLIRMALRDPDVSVKMPAADLAASSKIDQWQQLLQNTWTRSLGADAWELRVQILDQLSDTDAGEMLARQSLDDSFRTVRTAAARVLGVPVPPLAGRCPSPPITQQQMTGEGPPRVFLELDSGTMVIELDLEAAPRHVSAFIDGIRRKAYDGRIFHRVVPSFVAQGGGPRGDGWGDEGWHLIDEIHPRPYRRGTVGMPKAGDDTGGSQIFITHLPTPHLDGRYTVFGQVVDGLELLDQIEVGSRIVKITVDESRFRKRVAF